jgi:carboxylate-amine ligase
MERPSFSLGIEEEYLIVHRDSRDLVAQPTAAFFAECQAALGDQVSAELLRCQIEVGTRPWSRVADAVDDLRRLRAAVAKGAEAHGYAVIAASTHPFAHWREQQHTAKPRYEEIWSDIGQPANRMMICGMHMHLGIEDPDLRIDLMNQVAYFLPHLLALSASSPFWEGQDTRLASYRLTVMDALPRSGFPDALASHSEYRALVDHLVDCGCIPDATKIWWDIRPSDRFPTLEQRITDVCPRLEDVAAIAALYQSVVAYLYRLRLRNQSWRRYPRTLLLENRWRAQRHGHAAELIDHGQRRALDPDALVTQLIDLVGPDAEMLGCADELAGLRRIVAEGTSATRQRALYAAALAEGKDDARALRAVVDDLIATFTA